MKRENEAPEMAVRVVLLVFSCRVGRVDYTKYLLLLRFLRAMLRRGNCVRGSDSSDPAVCPSWERQGGMWASLE
jgi:hypothetical protein